MARAILIAFALGVLFVLSPMIAIGALVLVALGGRR